MPETTVTALSAEETRSYLRELPDVLSTGANLSKYREVLRPLAHPTDAWLGLLLRNRSLQEGFYPLIRVERWEMPQGARTGRLHAITLLKGAWLVHAFLMRTSSTTPVLVAPADMSLLPSDCPRSPDTAPTCGTCDLWAHCVTGRLSFGTAHYVTIDPYHFKKVTKQGGEWVGAGTHLARLSFRHAFDSVEPFQEICLPDLPALPQWTTPA